MVPATPWRTPMRLPIALLVLAAAISPLHAQRSARPDWKVRLDDPANPPKDGPLSAVETMSPGWHMTTGASSAIYYDPAWRGAGSYRLDATVFVFPESEQEGYGLFLGGQHLEAPSLGYLYVLLRRDGKYTVKHRQGGDVHEITPWTAHAAIAQPTDKPAKNVLGVTVAAGEIGIEVNGQKVATLDRTKVTAPLDGQAGLRVNHGVNLHVTEVKVTPSR